MTIAKNTAKAHIQNIVDLVDALNAEWIRIWAARDIDEDRVLDESERDELIELEKRAGGYQSREDVEQAIQEKPLSIEVRSGWASSFHDFTPNEFRIVLCTGGPHVEIRGDIGLHGEPQDVKVFYADWAEKGEYSLSVEEREAVTEFCQQFYFGE